MDRNQHIKFVTYVTCAHNKQNNDKWRKKVESKTKQECEIDDLGFLVFKNVNKSVTNSPNFNTQSTNDLKSPHPTGVLQDPTHDASALNSVVYALCRSHLADPILDSIGCIGHQLIKFGCGKVPYNQEVHFRSKNLIEKQMSANASIEDPVSILKSAFVDDLVQLGVLLTVECATSMNIGIALSSCLMKQSSLIDYVVVHKTDKKLFFNGVKPHFDINLRNVRARYALLAFVSSTGTPGLYSCFCRYGDCLYEMQNTKMTVISETAYVEFARSAEFFIFKLVSSLSSSIGRDVKPPAGSLKTEYVTGDVFEFEPAHKKRKAVPTKRKITVAHTTNEVQHPWLGFSETGRLDMYTEQLKICQSTNRWYDDIIINSYSIMCRQHKRSSFLYQDTCLTSSYSPGKLMSADQKFIQILNPYNTHWFCVSNALTFVDEPHVVELFDSMKSLETLSSVLFLDMTTSQLILQLRPLTRVIRYIKCQQQQNSYDCGPFALGFLWALSEGTHPLQYEHLRGPMIRQKVMRSFIENRFIAPAQNPKMYRKRVLKCFDFDSNTKRFVARV